MHIFSYTHNHTHTHIHSLHTEPYTVSLHTCVLLGFGSVNPCSPDQNCTSPFSYKNVLKLTDKGEQFNQLVSQQQISGNLDSTEGGFDAIMQVAVCGVS